MISAARELHAASGVPSRPAMQGADLVIEGLGKSFGGLKVLSDVTLQARPGRITGLIGPNGCGKSTCFNIVSGFLEPGAGSIRLDGKDITRWSVQQRCRVGLIRTFQTPKVFESMTVVENLMMGQYKLTGSGILSAMFRLPASRRELSEMRVSAEKICERFSLEGVRDQQCASLPTGVRRLVEIARAYAAEPRILMLDEPSSGLSAIEIDLLKEWLVELSREGISILLVSHDMGLMTISDKVHALSFGCIVAEGSMDEIRANPIVREAYLGV